MLKPLPEIKKIEGEVEPIHQTCECCGVTKPGHECINIMIQIGSPGHKDLPSFQCPFEQHWACSIECWQKVAYACIDEHISEIIKKMHSIIGEKNEPASSD